MYNEQPPYQQYNNIEIHARKSKASKLILLIIPAIFAFVGLCFLAFSIIMTIIPKNQEKKCTEEVTAVVVDMNEMRSTHKSGKRHYTTTTYAPVYRYEYNGEEYTKKSNLSSSNPKFSLGDKVKIMLDPNDPTNFYAPDDNTMSVLSTIFLIVGGALMLVSIIVTVLILKNKTNKMHTTMYNTDQMIQ